MSAYLYGVGTGVLAVTVFYVVLGLVALAREQRALRGDR